MIVDICIGPYRQYWTSFDQITIDWLFDTRVMPEPNTGCWLWTKCVNASGYPQISMGGDIRMVSRIVAEKRFGPFDRDLKVLHKCDQPSCINPDHLFIGTQMDNVRDMIAKGRNRPATSQRHWKLSVDAVRQIRELKGKMMNKEIAVVFGVSAALIGHILRGRAWKGK